MRHRIASTILLLYPRRVRRRHGPEITAVIDDLIAHEARSPTRLYLRLAVDGLIQRAVSTATAWTLVAALTTTSLGVLAISDLSVASAHKAAPHRAHRRADTKHARSTPPPPAAPPTSHHPRHNPVDPARLTLTPHAP